MTQKTVLEALEVLFSAKYLFDPAHSLLRVVFSPDSSGEELPPLVPLRNLLLHSEIAAAVNAAIADSDDEDVKLALLKDAASRATSVELVSSGSSADANQRDLIRRKAFLRPEEDPALRSVFVRPVHPDATTAEIASFFGAFGAVEDVTQRVGLKGSGSVLSASAVVVFTTVEGARACAEASAKKSLSYGSTTVPLAMHFIPKLVAKMLRDHQETVAEQVRVAEQKQLHANIVEARKDLSDVSAAPSASFEWKRQLPVGRTLKCDNLPAHVSWEQIKANIGNLSLSQPVLKGALSLVRIVEGGNASPFAARTALLVFKSPEAVEHLVATYSLATIDYIEKIRALCPTLSRLTPAEESWVRSQYSSWTDGKGGRGKRGRE